MRVRFPRLRGPNRLALPAGAAGQAAGRPLGMLSLGRSRSMAGRSVAAARGSRTPPGVREPLRGSGVLLVRALLCFGCPRLQLGPSPPRPPSRPRHAARRPCPAGPGLPASATRSRLRPWPLPWPGPSRLPRRLRRLPQVQIRSPKSSPLAFPYIDPLLALPGDLGRKRSVAPVAVRRPAAATPRPAEISPAGQGAREGAQSRSRIFLRITRAYRQAHLSQSL